MVLCRRFSFFGTANLFPKRFLSFKQHHKSLALQWQSTSPATHFNYTWLRDNCTCPQCLHPSAKQKLVSSGDIPLDIKPTSQVSIADGKLKIRWNKSLDHDPKEHESIFDLQWLKENGYTGDQVLNRRLKEHSYITWDKKSVQDVDLWMSFDDFISPDNKEKNLCRFLNILQDYGLAFLRNVPASPEDYVAKVAQHIGPIRETFYGRLFDVKSVPSAKNIAYASVFLGLHMDLMYFEAPPGLQFLHCLENSVTGGGSIFLDSFKAVHILREHNPKAFEDLCRIPVTFHYINDGHHMRFRRPTITVTDTNQPMLVYYAPPFQGPLEAESVEDTDAFYAAFKELSKIINDPSLLYSIRLGPGDCAVFANRRVLHGRESFDNQSGKRHLKGTYIDFDSFKDRLRVLQSIHGRL